MFHYTRELPAVVDLVAVTSPRHPAEALYSQSRGAYVILIDRPGTTADASEVTAKQIGQVALGIRLHNDGDLDRLLRCSRQLRRDAVTCQPSDKCRAASFSS